VKKEILLRLFNSLIRGKSFERTVYDTYMETRDDELYTIIEKKIKNEEVSIPYTNEAETLSTIDEDRERLAEHLRKIIGIEYIKEEIETLKKIFRKRMTILLLIMYITIPIIAAFTPIFTAIQSIEISKGRITSQYIEPRWINIYILHGLASETISTIYINRLVKIKTTRLLLLMSILFITIYPAALNYLTRLLP
jgi:uncharacterized membrane protein (DUF485 family)